MHRGWMGMAIAVLAPAGAMAGDGALWWNKDWTGRLPIVLDTSADGAALEGAVEDGARVLVRLAYGSFPFDAARADGGDLRFIAADGVTSLPFELENYDSVLGEGFAWVRLPGLKPGAKESLHLYYGNAAAGAPGAAAPDKDNVLVYHFAGDGASPVDSSGHQNNAGSAGIAVPGALIGGGLRVGGGTGLEIPNSGTLAWTGGQHLTVSLWIRPDAAAAEAVLLARGSGAAAFELRLEAGVPVVKSGAARVAAAGPVGPGVWTHLAVVADGKDLSLYQNGDRVARGGAVLAEQDGPLALGGPLAEGGGAVFAGGLDEFSIASAARSAAWVKWSAVSQGDGANSSRAVAVGTAEGGEAEGGSHLMEHLSLFGDIARNMMFDGWIAIGVCAVMIVVGWTVAVRKFLYLNSIEKGTAVFLERWKALSTDLTALDPGDHGSVASLGGRVDSSKLDLVGKSPLYHIYQIGAGEIRHRLDQGNVRGRGLNGRSIQAIRASLDAGLVHETQRLSRGLVYLTMSIAGGPYVGLLGTVVGVMITFAIIAKSGEVNVNSIAPGIASALLATVVGLIVAIPALFIYSYLNARIKNSLGLMQVFIDEFVAKMAEFHHPGEEKDQAGGSGI